MLKEAYELSVLKEKINYILNKLSETENVLRREKSVSTYSQERKLSDIQDFAFNLVREFDKACDNFYAAARAVESFEDDIMNKISLDRMKMYIDIDKIRNGEKVEGKSLVPKEFSDYKNYLIDEDSAINFIFSKVLKLIICNKVYSGDEVDNLPKKIAYRKDGFLYIYELRETPIYKLYGTDFYGDYGIFEATGDREYADKFKRYSYVKVYSTEPEVKLGVVDTSNLRNLENFAPGALEHIFEGEINRRGNAVGFHYENYPTTRGEIITGTKTNPNNFGVYRGKIKVDGRVKTTNRGESTFFPEDWTPQQVIDSINVAYLNKDFVQGTNGKYRGITSSGFKIEMYLDGITKKIKSVFPKY